MEGFLVMMDVEKANGGTNAKYFKLNRGPRQGDPIPTYLFILAFEIIFFLLKKILI